MELQSKETEGDIVGISAFYKNAAGEIFHTYSAYQRGVETINGAYHMLDLAPKDRDEDALQFPQSWVRYHDQYEG